MQPDEFFLRSKRFWMGVIGAPIAAGLTWLAAKGIDIEGVDPEILSILVANVIVWLFGMWQGRRKLTLTKPAPPITEDQLRELVKAELAAMPVKARIADAHADRVIETVRASRLT